MELSKNTQRQNQETQTVCEPSPQLVCLPYLLEKDVSFLEKNSKSGDQKESSWTACSVIKTEIRDKRKEKPELPKDLPIEEIECAVVDLNESRNVSAEIMPRPSWKRNLDSKNSLTDSCRTYTKETVATPSGSKVSFHHHSQIT